MSLFDPLIIGTGKLCLTDDNGWLYSLCDAIRQRYIFRLQWSYISILSLPLTRHSSPYTKQPIYLHSIPIERPEKKINRPINQFKLHPTSKHTIRTTRTRSHPIPTYQRKSLSSRIHTHISAHAQSMSHSTPPLTSTPSSSGTCKYDIHVAQDSTVYENSTTTSTSSSSSFYDDYDDDDEDDEEEEEEPFIILQATAMKITSFPAAAVAKIFVKGKGSGIATTTSQKVGRTPVRATAGPPAFLATSGDALPVFSSERAKRAARSVR